MVIIPLSQMPTLPSLESVKEAGAQQGAQGLPFSEVFQEALENVRETQAIANQDSYDLAMGKTDNLAGVMINAAKAATAVEMTVQLTSRAVNAYKEIMQMQV